MSKRLNISIEQVENGYIISDTSMGATGVGAIWVATDVCGLTNVVDNLAAEGLEDDKPASQ